MNSFSVKLKTPLYLESFQARYCYITFANKSISLGPHSATGTSIPTECSSDSARLIRISILVQLTSILELAVSLYRRKREREGSAYLDFRRIATRGTVSGNSCSNFCFNYTKYDEIRSDSSSVDKKVPSIQGDVVLPLQTLV